MLSHFNDNKFCKLFVVVLCSRNGVDLLIHYIQIIIITKIATTYKNSSKDGVMRSNLGFYIIPHPLYIVIYFIQTTLKSPHLKNSTFGFNNTLLLTPSIKT